MKKRFTRLMALALAAVLFGSLAVPAAAAADTGSLGALLDSYASNAQTFTLSDSSRIYVAGETDPAGELLQTVQLLRKQFAADGYEMDIICGSEAWASDGDILIDLDADCGLKSDGYKLDVTGIAKITAPDADGLIYGANMLLKAFRNAGTNTIQGFTAKDEPDTVQRAVSLDCGRKYYTKNWICNFIRQMSWMGYNTLELHFSDDSGFRMDFWDEAYYTENYQPANDFTWLCGSNYTSWTLSAYQDDKDKGKFLTTAEIVEILETAKEYHIDVIPAFDSPSHLDYTTWKFEQNYDSNNNYSFYSTYDDKTYYAKDINGIINYTSSKDWSTDLKWPYYAAINVKKDQAKAFIFELYIDIANFFKEYAGSTDFSIGADEVQLNTSNLATGYSYAWGFADFVTYINDLNTLLNGKGYTMRMYNDFMGSKSYNASNYKFADNIEILYWDSPFNPSSSTASNHTEPVSYFVNQGRTLYNCIQTNTYYALRKTSGGSDARSVRNRQWTFYHADEESIYNEWYSADISEHGDYSEDVADVPAANLGGAYFLIWCDYACISTETEIWNGCYDTDGSGEYYSLLDRMWSNTIKMWNWDINDTVTYSSYAALREKFGYFPGYASSDQMPSFEADVSVAVDHSALEAALAEKISAGSYTAESYAAYQKAYDAAVAVNSDQTATLTAINQAIAALEEAENNLVCPVRVTVYYKTIVGGEEKTVKTEAFSRNPGSYSHYVRPLTGYTYQSCSGARFTPNQSGDGSGCISGSLSADTAVTIWYENAPDSGRMDYLIRNAIPAKGSYTEASWTAYETALNAAKNFTATAATMQKDIDKLVRDLENAERALVANSAETKIIAFEKLAETFRVGKQVGLKITTTPDIPELTVTDSTEANVTLTLCVGRVQTLSSGETVKIWLVHIPAKEAGTETYTIHGETASADIQVTIN